MNICVSKNYKSKRDLILYISKFLNDEIYIFPLIDQSEFNMCYKFVIIFRFWFEPYNRHDFHCVTSEKCTSNFWV